MEGFKDGLGLVHAFLVFARGDGVGNDGGSSIHVAAMTDVENRRGFPQVVDFVEDAIIAHPHTPAFPSG
jgi:hypothetical protein